jgi:membrane protein YdbS with pleckstrin-like domain
MAVKVSAMAGYASKSHMLQGGFLAPSEKVLLETHPSKWFYFPGPLIGLVLLLLADYVAATGVFRSLPALPVVTAWLRSIHFPFLSGSFGLPNLLLYVALAATLVVGLWLVYRVFDWISDVYAVTNERLIKQHGIVTHNFNEIPINQVHNVAVYQRRLAARILRFGTLQMDSLANLSRSGAVMRSEADLETARGVSPLTNPRLAAGNPYMNPRDRLSADSVNPYMNPRDPLANDIGVQIWLMVPDPIRIQRTIERAAERVDPGRGAYP